MSRNSHAVADRETDATLRALRRAARLAAEIGVKTGRAVYAIKDHRIVDLTKSDRMGVRKLPQRDPVINQSAKRNTRRTY